MHFKGRRKLALLDKALLKEVVNSCHLVVLITIETLGRIVFLKAIAFEISEQRGLNRDLVLSDDETLTLADRLVGLIPRVLFNLRSCQALVWVRFQDFVDQVDTLGR